MKLLKSKIVGFIPCQNLDRAKLFFSDKLGLKLLKSDEYALEYNVSDTSLRVTKVSEVAHTDYAILGWEVDGLYSTVNELKENGVEFVKYKGIPQDDMSICVFPGGSKVAWFKDPDGNTLSITQR